jgi:hypothetical protein
MKIESGERGILNLDAVLAQANVSAVVKMLAARAKNGEYILPGQYLKSLNDFDLATLVNLADAATFNDSALFNMVCLAEILANTEGYPAMTDADAQRNIGFLITLLTSIMLARKGLVEVLYDNISFADSAGEDTIVKIIE